MACIECRLQEIQLPVGEEFADTQSLFCREGLSRELHRDRVMPETRLWNFQVRGGKIIPDADYLGASQSTQPDLLLEYDAAREGIVVPAESIGDFSCYLNMLSANRWLEYTFARDFTLSVDVSGKGKVLVFAYHVDDFETFREVGTYLYYRDSPEAELENYAVPIDVRVIASADFESDSPTRVSLPLGAPDATLLGFAIETGAGKAWVHGGGWYTTVDEEKRRDVQLCIATTTFRKEEFIKGNIAALKRMVANDAEMADHFQMIVVDNGQTLDGPALEDEHVRVFPNINAGGAGGFARGMIEAMKLEKAPTHLLIMDDDVLVLPESIKRTYQLLRILKPRYWDSYISGAMLRYEAKTIQHEDIGFIHGAGWFAPKKPAHRLDTIYECAINEVEWPYYPHQYAAWWYCCIPMKFVTPKTLPVPVFIRGDDVEFAVRNNIEPISMNGICVWHMGFGGKFSGCMEYYQVVRNSLILGALHDNLSDVDFIDRIDTLFNEITCGFSYDHADLVLDALEDYLVGPSLLEKPNGIDIVKEKSQKNEKLVPLEQIFTGDLNIKEMFNANVDGVVKTMQRKFTTFTRNEQQFVRTPGKGLGVTPADWGYSFANAMGKEKLIALNPYDGMATLRVKDLKRFDAVKKRYIELTLRYIHENERVAAEWKAAYPRFTSLEFWNEYLGLS